MPAAGCHRRPRREAKKKGAALTQRGPQHPSVIVVGVDGSDSAWRAAAYAAGLAGRQGSVLVLAYVRQANRIASALGPFALEAAAHVAEELERQVRDGAERLCEPLTLRWEFRCVPGEVFAGLMSVADDLRADAIVVGACRNPLHRFLGSPSLRLVKARRWPVIVVP